MSPEYGATCGIFPVDAEAIRYLRLSGRSEEQIALVEAYAKAQGMWHEPDSPPAEYSATLEPDLSTAQPSLDRKSVVSGQSVSVPLDPGGRRTFKKKQH